MRGKLGRINARSLDRLVADTFLPKTDVLADQPVHLDSDPENCCADNLVWRMHPSRDSAAAQSEVCLLRAQRSPAR